MSAHRVELAMALAFAILLLPLTALGQAPEEADPCLTSQPEDYAYCAMNEWDQTCGCDDSGDCTISDAATLQCCLAGNDLTGRTITVEGTLELDGAGPPMVCVPPHATLQGTGYTRNDDDPCNSEWGTTIDGSTFPIRWFDFGYLLMGEQSTVQTLQLTTSAGMVNIGAYAGGTVRGVYAGSAGSVIVSAWHSYDKVSTLIEDTATATRSVHSEAPRCCRRLAARCTSNSTTITSGTRSGA